MNAERNERQRAAATVARDIWERSPPACVHPFLTHHGIAAHGLRQLLASLLVPMRDAAGDLWNVQFIAPGGRTKRVHGARVLGLFHLIGEPGERVHIAEDYITAAKVHAHTGEAVAVAFAIHNLRPVALALRAAHPGAALTVWLPAPPQGFAGVFLGHRGALVAASAAANATRGAVAFLRATP